jgi:hypothetical protein
MLLAAAAFTLTSCGKYLDKDPEDSLPVSDIDYTDMSNLYQPVSGVYAKIRTGAMHWVIWPQVIIRDDDIWSGRTDDQGDLVDIGNYKYKSGFWGLNEMWNQYYGIIKVANSALEALDLYAANMTTEDQLATYRSYCGEVRFLRAYTYFRLVQAFGPVTILRSNDQTDLTRSTVNAVYKYALEDLQYAIENCQRLNPNEMTHKGAVTAYSAEMLAAKIYLNQGNYEQVKTLTDDIINSGKFELYDDFYELFKIPGKLCNESLFECQCTDFGTGSGDMVDVDQWFVFQGPGSLGGWNFIRFYPSFYEWAEARGETVRLTTTCMAGGGTTTPSGDVVTDGTTEDYFNGKAYTPTSELTEGRTKYGSNNNVRIFRYADVLLMNAEAAVRLGQNGDEPFNQVRRRANMPELANVTVDEILDERRMELAGEWGERYNDLVRTGNAASVLGSNGWTEDKTYYPVPFQQLSDVPELKNDPIDE